jgi:spore maturation protein A
MLGKIFGALCGLSLVFGTLSKRLPEVASAIPDGAGKAIEVTLTLLGMMCLWSGVMQVLSDAGIVQKISRLFAPLLRHIFPKAYRTGEGYEEICSTLSANFLGVGNAATPFALCAMKKMQAHNPTPEIADNEQITLAVLSTASLTLVPANLLALRRAAGSADPFCIMIPVWITSLLCVAFALLLTSFLHIRGRFSRIRASKKDD